MIHKLTFTLDELNQMESLVNNINLRKENHDVSIFIDPKKNQVILIGGKDEELEQVTFSINTQSMLKKGQWSLNGSYFKENCEYFRACKSPFSLDLVYSNNSPYPEVDTSAVSELRNCSTAAVRDTHSEFFEALKKRQSDSISVTSVRRMLSEIKTHLPYEFIALDHEHHQLRIQSNQLIRELALPESVHIPISMVLTQDATKKLSYVCEQTDSDNINVSVHNEIVTFSTPTHTVTSSLAGLAEFYQKKPVECTCEAKLIVAIYSMKHELEVYHKKYPEIKRANSSHLLIEHDNVMVASIVKPFEFAKSILMVDIKIEQARLYQINLREVIAVKIKDLTDVKKKKLRMTLQILKMSDGKRVLGFYNNRNPHHPYDTVPIELDMQSLPKVLELREKEQEKKKNKKEEPQLEVQPDMIGYEDM